MIAALTLANLLDRGLLDYYSYNRNAAYATYELASQRDPNSAMAYWGMALSRSPNINTPADAGDFREARPLIARAVGLEATATPRDRALIDALALRFAGDWDAHDADARAYREQMAVVAAAYPEDDDVAMLYAEALAENGAWAQVASLTATVLARDPEHPMADHLCVHAYDDAAERSPAIPCAMRLDAMTFAPEQEHLAHMPAHAWIETGDYARAVASSERGYRLSEALRAEPDAAPSEYEDHDVAIGYSAAMYLGNYAAAMRWRERGARLSGRPDALRSQTMARFGRWIELLALPPSKDDAQLPAARALALARLGRWDEAATDYKALPAATKDTAIGAIADARLLERAGKVETAVSVLRGFAKKQRLNYEAEYVPAWPVAEAIGGIYLRAKRYEDAAAAFAATLAQYPRDPRALYGLEAAADAESMPGAAAEAKGKFDAAWAGADTALGPDDI